MTALSLLRHTTGLLTTQPLKTLIVIRPALLLIIGLSILIMVTTSGALTNSESLSQPTIPSNWPLFVALGTSCSLMALLWHRHSLTDLGILPPLSVPLFLKYLWRVSLLAAIQSAVNLAFVVPLLLFSQNNGQGVTAPATSSVVLVVFATQLLLVWLSLRLSLILPAAAIGQPIHMTQSWYYTRTVARSLWGVAAVFAAINTAVTILIAQLGLTATFYTFALKLPVYLVEGMFILCIQTTLYASAVYGDRQTR